jgi:hypothetical protein
MHRRGDLAVRCGNGRYLADHIADALYLELPGQDHIPQIGDSQPLIDAICRFAGSGASQPAAPRAQDRWLATLLFVDIVGSTDLAVRLGDGPWRDL